MIIEVIGIEHREPVDLAVLIIRIERLLHGLLILSGQLLIDLIIYILGLLRQSSEALILSLNRLLKLMLILKVLLTLSQQRKIAFDLVAAGLIREKPF